MLAKMIPVRGLLCLVLGIQVALAGVVAPPAARDEPGTTSTTTQVESSTTPSSSSPSSTNSEDVTGSQTSAPSGTTASETSSGSAGPSSSSVTLSSTITSLTSTQSTPTASHLPYLNTTIPDGQLPLQPEITPAWAVAGVLLIVGGAVFALIGIRTRWLHTFLSTVLLASLGTTILIVYVMTLPVTTAIQGAYLVAVVCTGLILGGAALLFRDITECLGCLLGGFCFSMWLLTCKTGGLLTDTSAKVGFIVAFTAAGFGLYFSRFTRQYALIGCIAFSGATAATLGIDCFSRAGLKEFWAYIWALNDNLFPLGVRTYPLTKGIRVEIAVTVLLCFLGVISQLKLWNVIRQRRAQKDAERLEDERNMQQEEEEIGRRLEQQNARQRRDWEATYGNGENSGRSESSEDMDNEIDADEKKCAAAAARKSKAAGNTPTTTTVRSLRRGSDEEATEKGDGNGNIEMTDLGEEDGGGNQHGGQAGHGHGDAKTPSTIHEAVMARDNQGGKITVRVAEDVVPNSPRGSSDYSGRGSQDSDGEPKVWVIGADGEARPASASSCRRSSRQSHAQAQSPPPAVVPLPFQVPTTGGHDDDVRSEGNRSSFATFADEDEDEALGGGRGGGDGKRASFVHRLSQTSKNHHLFRRHGSQRSHHSRRSGVGSPTPLGSPLGGHHGRSGPGESTEELVVNDARSSVAATVDGLSSDSGEGRMTPLPMDDQAAREAGGQQEEGQREGGGGEEKRADAGQGEAVQRQTETLKQTRTTTKSHGHDVPSKKNATDTNTTEDNTEQPTSSYPPTDPLDTPPVDANANESLPSASAAEDITVAKRSKSAASGTSTTTPASLTKERLPSGLSKIALSYRTNEWAKHLSHAETPAPDAIRIVPLREQQKQKQQKEMETKGQRISRKNNGSGAVAHEGGEEDGGEDEGGETVGGSGYKREEEEPSAPINVEELQLRADNGVPPPALPRSSSKGSVMTASQMEQQQQQAVMPGSRQAALQILSQGRGGAGVPDHTPSGASSQSPNRNSSNGAAVVRGSLQQNRNPSTGRLRRSQSGMAVQPITEEEDEPNNNNSNSNPHQAELDMDPPAVHDDVDAIGPDATSTPMDRSTSTASRPGAGPAPGPGPDMPSFTSPQTLIGQRDLLLRNRSSGALPTAPDPNGHGIGNVHGATGSDAGSLYNYLPSSKPAIDADDLPLAQRREMMMMRQNSKMSHQSGTINNNNQQPVVSAAQGQPRHASRRVSNTSINSTNPLPMAMPTSSSAPMLSSPPPTNTPPPNHHYQSPPSARESKLASFRQSVAADLRATMGGTPPQHPQQHQGVMGNSRSRASDTNAAAAMMMMRQSSTTGSMLYHGNNGGGGSNNNNTIIEAQRSYMMSQKEAEAQRRESERLQREQASMVLDERMRRGEFMEAHREAMRRMQRGLDRS